ncbi:hypothetical protein BU26DRAFT_574581 [Trematosphaeria pertusa]|uniref:protein disulfide-isomerase n=1 Tax=Trematosphaeria pertusa TaxID=390896 RepID=A0A6A6J2M4_9PLEO|nr:uncharacterized protein BU26DRAFT_574581 [Trematosphaeria pertusa]KAF2256452.1 hypothetical protein BU26DRAFT_574581 [Trematosphaeria pertusa]
MGHATDAYCDEEKELCGSYDVNAYPAVRLFKKNGGKDVEVTRYRGRRTKRAIRSFVTKHEIPTVTHIEPENVGAFKATDDIVIMAYLRPDQEALLEVFRTVASKHHADYVFGYVTDMPTADAEGLAMPSIVCYKNTDGDNKVMNGHFSEADVGKFLETATRTVIGEFNERNMDVYMAADKLAAYIFAATDNEANALRWELTPVAKKFDKYVTFGVADAVEYAPMAESFGLSERKFPALAVHAPMNDNVFIYRQGKRIMASVVEAMLTTILQAKAGSGQVFGSDAPEMEGEVTQDMRKGHDEL